MRVLQVIGAMDCGGAESLVMNLYRNVDRTKVQFDFVVHTQRHCFYDREIHCLGGTIYRAQKYDVGNYFAYRRWWAEFFGAHPEYRVVHGHIGSSAAIYLHEARRAGRYAIAHSHNTSDSGISLHRIAWEACSWPTRFVADSFFGCSRQAGIDRYGRRVVHSRRYRQFNNAIDGRRFRFSAPARERIRREYGLEDAFVVGHIGRFVPQKNHERLLEIFRAVYARERSARLLLLGEGPLEGQMRQRCAERGIADAVIFAGVHDNAQDYDSAMDVFCFPSRWEGLGMAAVEAQANGLPCVAADAVPREADIGAGLFEALSLKQPDAIWADAILARRAQPHMRDAEAYLKAAGYDIAEQARWLMAFYLAAAEGKDL